MSLLLPLACSLALASPTMEEIDRWELVRVDVPDHPEAIGGSATASVLLAPPSDGSPWRVEEVPEIDLELLDEQPDTGEVLLPEEGDALVGVGTWRAWEGEAAMHLAAWHEAGFDGSYPDGSGVKVAIFDVQWLGVEDHPEELGEVHTRDCWAHRSCELPMNTLEPRFSWEIGSHGRGCAEIVRDLAPGVELYLVRVNTVTSLENAVDWAVREGIDVVSMSMSFFNNSFYDGTGPVVDLMDRLHAGGVMMVTSAGNYADEHWGGPFDDPDGDGVHDFFADRTTLPIYYSSAATRRITLLWDEFSDCGRTDLDATVYLGDGTVVGRASRVQDPDDESCSPVERITVQMPYEGWAYLAIERARGVGVVDMDLIARSGAVWNGVPAGSITDPGTHPDVLTVGAVRAAGYAFNGPEVFSSVGPTNGGFPKPDLTAPDGISSSIYGPSAFYGTSAASPSATAAIAVLMSAEPGIDAFEAADRLKGHLLSDRDTWQEQDPGLGRGRIRLAAPDADLASPSGCTGRRETALLLPALVLLPIRRRLLRGSGRRAGRAADRLQALRDPP